MLKSQTWFSPGYRQLISMTTPFALLTILGCGDGGESSSIASNLSAPKNVAENSTADQFSDSVEMRQTEQGSATTSLSTDLSADSESSGEPESTEETSLPPPIIFSEEEPMLTAIPSAPTVSVNIDWSHSSDSNVTNYYVYYGKQPSTQLGLCSYEDSQSVEAPPAMISGLEPNTPYFFAISAFNESESTCSTEIMIVTPPVSPQDL